MSVDYDECLDRNPFFQSIQQNHSDIIHKATEEDWIICVPRVGTIETTTITPEDILEHVLIPNLDLPDTHFCTLTKREITISGKFVSSKNDEPIRILFDETFYVDKCRKYKLWCIERPLHCGSKYDAYVGIKNVHDCIKLLWGKNCVLDHINDAIQGFLADRCECDDLEMLRGKIVCLYTSCIKELQQKTDHLDLAVETYMQHCIHRKLFRGVCNYTSQLDANFNKITRNLAHIQLKDLEIGKEFYDGISGAKRPLNGVNKATTVLSKVDCLRRTINALSALNKSNACLTADDLLKIFVFLVIKSNVSNWIGNLTYLTHFRLSPPNCSDETSFLLTTLEAAIEYIKTGTLVDDCNQKSDLEHEDTVSALFRYVRSGDLDAIAKCFDARSDLIVDKTHLCHPLCSCEKCENVVPFGVNSRDEKSCTILHVACLFGQPHVVEFLIGKNVDVDAADYSEAVPLHYAALKGHQNALLLLLHANACIDPKNCDGNTPLHLATNNGHESCVKALLYFSEQKGGLLDVNERNNMGDTALHFAVKWGYSSIATILLQYGAEINATNKRHEKVVDVAHNDYLRKLLLSNLGVETKDQQLFLSIKSDHTGIKPKNIEQIKRTDLALKSIENNDLPLTCYYLGIPTPPSTTKLDGKSTCHPLCTCDNCLKQFENTTTIPAVCGEALNVNTCNADGHSPLHVAATCGRSDILRLLLDSGALVNLATYKNRSTPLHLACSNRQIQVVRELLKCGGCDVDVKDAKGNSPLHYACFSNDGRIVELLLSHGCNSNVKNGEGKTALQEAKGRMMFNIVSLLKGKGDVESSTESLSDLLSEYDCI